jgi:hypothetical protein
MMVAGLQKSFIDGSETPNPAFERDAAKARRPSTLRWANRKMTAASTYGER